ncbi:unnamed protein product [Medioppia subpectinata]|uniref:Uncharacterized protein n=1 Tax=Medioppia subpectinata TaxID=1979941 RepID=A0A7R9QIT4_9ACAR|nr:unnamed protein product [Medioppia subpectinata]CAG2121360.1 unnamed protein product [Medioppia subpectinata]
MTADVHSVGAIGQELFDMNIHDVNALQKYSSHELRDNFAKLFKVFVSMGIDVRGQTCGQVINQYYDWSIDKHSVKRVHDFNAILYKSMQSDCDFFYKYIVDKTK